MKDVFKEAKGTKGGGVGGPGKRDKPLSVQSSDLKKRGRRVGRKGSEKGKEEMINNLISKIFGEEKDRTEGISGPRGETQRK